MVVSLYEVKKLPVTKICEMMGISKSTLYSYVREAQEKTNRV
ncbi:helix-turn-helix domain-containing protein [Nitrosococcus oceani]